MSKFIGFAVTIAFICSGISIANAANDGSWVTCRDGMKMHSGGACENHGGVLIEPTKSTSTPIDTRKGLTPSNTATAKKTQTQKTAATTKPQKAVSKKTSGPTARCNDGAMYYSTKRSGACAAHGGVRSWF